jgi:hypothetical protein
VVQAELFMPAAQLGSPSDFVMRALARPKAAQAVADRLQALANKPV